MNDTALDSRPRIAFSGRSLLLRLLICVVTIGALSIGGALLMHAAIDPAADSAEGAGAVVAAPADSH